MNRTEKAALTRAAAQRNNEVSPVQARGPIPATQPGATP